METQRTRPQTEREAPERRPEMSGLRVRKIREAGGKGKRESQCERGAPGTGPRRERGKGAVWLGGKGGPKEDLR